MVIVAETVVIKPLLLCSVGSRDHPPLSKDALPVSRDTDRLAGRPLHYREARQEQAEAHLSGDSREACTRPQGCQIRGVFSSYTGTTPCTYLHVSSRVIVVVTLVWC